MESQTHTGPAILPPKLKAGDTVRFVSPASTPDKDAVLARAGTLESWGLRVDFGDHAFDTYGYLAGTDAQRLGDLNAAFRDPEVRAVFATRGGKGSYRIADQIDFEAVRRDPKMLVGFSDITILHLALWKHCRLIGIGGAMMGEPDDPGQRTLRRLLTSEDDAVLQARDAEPTAALTTSGKVSGRVIGGNLDLISTAAGWALPKLHGAILLIEAVSMYPGQVDRQLTMLRKAGHLDGVAGIAVGQFVGFNFQKRFNVIAILRDHLAHLGVPILGGLPYGHGEGWLSLLHGGMAVLDADAGTLSICGREASD